MQDRQKLETHWKTQTDLEHLTEISTLYAERLTTEAEILVRFAALRPFDFRDTRYPKINQKCTETEIEHLIVKMRNAPSDPNWTLNSQNYSILTKYLPQRPKFWCVLVYDQHGYQDTGSPEIGNAPNDPKMNLNSQYHLAVYTLTTYPWGPNFGPFRTTTSGSQDIALLKIPHGFHVKHIKKEKKKQITKNPKFEIFIILYTTLLQTFPRSIHEFLVSNLLCTVRQDVVWSFFSHMVPC